MTHEASPSESCPRVGDLWQLLVEGRVRIVDFKPASESSPFVVEVLETPATRLDGRTVTILERLLSGESQKSCAYEAHVSQSTVTTVAKRGLRELGIACLPSRAPLLLAILVCASRERGEANGVRVSPITRDGRRYLLLSTPPVDELLPGVLSDAERAVATLLIEGLHYREIAAHRHTSHRTVANQLAEVFRSMRVSGRGQLLALTARSVPRASSNDALAPVSG